VTPAPAPGNPGTDPTSNGASAETASAGGASQRDPSAPLIEAHDLAKRYCRSLKRSMWYGLKEIAKDATGRRRAVTGLRKGEFWALAGVDFALQPGEALGLVGPNGSGKTTLLKLISGVLKPDRGSVTVRGRVAPLIALKAGFNPVLSGRENATINMALLGLSTDEIDERFDDVVDFAEIPHAIDAPVRTYSSGMVARLGFACAIHTHPDILLLDEVLAVGDIRFRAKCHQKLHELREAGTSFILVSHSPHRVQAVCERAIYLSDGRVVAEGGADEVLARYERDLFVGDDPGDLVDGVLELPGRSPQMGDLDTGLTARRVMFRDAEGRVADPPISGEPASLCVGVRCKEPFDALHIKVTIKALADESAPVLVINSHNDAPGFPADRGEHELRLDLPWLGLMPGLYTLRVHVMDGPLRLLDTVPAFRFAVGQGPDLLTRCQYNQPRSWSCVPADAPVSV